MLSNRWRLRIVLEKQNFIFLQVWPFCCDFYCSACQIMRCSMLLFRFLWSHFSTYQSTVLIAFLFRMCNNVPIERWKCAFGRVFGSEWANSFLMFKYWLSTFFGHAHDLYYHSHFNSTVVQHHFGTVSCSLQTFFVSRDDTAQNFTVKLIVHSSRIHGVFDLHRPIVFQTCLMTTQCRFSSFSR